MPGSFFGVPPGPAACAVNLNVNEWTGCVSYLQSHQSNHVVQTFDFAQRNGRHMPHLIKFDQFLGT